MLIIHPATGEIHYANQAALNFYGYSEGELIGMNINQINTLSSEEVEEERLRAKSEERNFFIFKHKLANGEIKTVHVYSYPVEIDGETFLFSIIIDQTEYAAAETRNRIFLNTIITMLVSGMIVTSVLSYNLWKKKKNLQITHELLEESEERFKILHNASFGGIAIHDKGCILDCNQGLSDLTGFTMDELAGMDGLQLIAPKYREYVMEKITSGFEKQYEAEGIRKNGEIYPLKLEARNIPFKGKNIRVVEFRDITEQKEKEEEIRYISFHDELTGLYNRRYFDEELLRYNHARQLPLTIIFADVDNLKYVNDTFGHLVGDAHLKQAASFIKSQSRGSDIVARWGGDEFVILMPESDNDSAKKYIARVKNMIVQTNLKQGELSISFGYCAKTKNEQDINDVFRLAEKMMYESKR
ncbi:MAG: diguanylate cyclase [Candidatus Izimaplasma sp.]|nr:diguanylate cyclase [Candidatus Izimaplasma bacterium]